jgi:hypothetical protein
VQPAGNAANRAAIVRVTVVLALVVLALVLAAARQLWPNESKTGHGTAPPSTSQPLPDVQWVIGPEFSSTWLFPLAPTELGRPPTHCDENDYRLWLQDSGAIPTFNSVAVALKANTDASVIVEGMSIRVLSRKRPPRAGFLVDCAIGGPGGRGPIGTATINLDRAKPAIAYADQYGERIPRLTFILERGVTELVMIRAESTESFITWEGSLLVLVGGAQRRIPLKNRDTNKPFKVAPGKGFKTYGWTGTTWRPTR